MFFSEIIVGEIRVKSPREEFYTTDGSGTVVATDVYQGLGKAVLGDAESIFEVVSQDSRGNHLTNTTCV